MKLPFDTDSGAGWRATIGLIMLQAEETLENEFRDLFALDGVALHHARIPSGLDVTPETLRAQAAEMTRTAALIPRSPTLRAIAYACTSGATMIGSDNVAAAIRQAHPGVTVTDPVVALGAALHHLGRRHLGFVSPYVATVSGPMRDLLGRQGFPVVRFGSFEQSEEAVVARITPQSLLQAIIAVGEDPAVEAVFASCTNLRGFPIIDAAEQRLGKPVLTSNQVLAWHLLHLTGLSPASPGPGRLFRPLPSASPRA